MAIDRKVKYLFHLVQLRTFLVFVRVCRVKIKILNFLNQRTNK